MQKPRSAAEKKVMDALDFDGISVKDSINNSDDEEDKEGPSPSTNEDAKLTQAADSAKVPLEELIEENKDTNQNDHYDDDEDKLFSCFEVGAAQPMGVDTKKILSNMNMEFKNREEQSVVAMIENHIHQHSIQKSSHSLDQIDQLINKNKIKQQEILNNIQQT